MFIEGSNLDTNKARLLLLASLMKLGRIPKARDPRNPTAAERKAAMAKVEDGKYRKKAHPGNPSSVPAGRNSGHRRLFPHTRRLWILRPVHH